MCQYKQKDIPSFYLYYIFCENQASLKFLKKSRRQKLEQSLVIHISYRTHLLPINRKLIIEGFEFSPSQQHFRVFGNTAVSQSN
jgi:hypothetical protein